MSDENGAGRQDGDGRENRKKPGKRIVLYVLAGVLVLLIAAGGVMAYRVFVDPTSAFKTAGDVMTLPEPVVSPSPEPSQTDTPSATPSQTPTPTQPPVDPYAELDRVADHNTMKDIVNIALLGIDYAPERTSGAYKRDNKKFYTDVVMVMAVNFKKQRVDLVSIPRDSWTEMPDKKGIYRIKEAFYFGGEMKSPDKGLQNATKAIEWQLGGHIPVDYYIGVTMPVVKEMVDIIGGVDYDVDYNININGRKLKKGFQHLNGQQALDYFRARKKGDIDGGRGDLHRVNRQKDLLVAIFKKLKNTQLLFKMPEIIKSLEGKLYTNLTLEQLAALAVFGVNLDEEKNISLHSFEGTITSIFNWSFCINNQAKRVEVIREVYGKSAKASQRKEYTLTYARALWASMQAQVYVARVQAILKKDAAREAPKLLPEEVTELTALVDTVTAELHLKKNKKPDVYKIDYKKLDKANKALKGKASKMFKTAGYKISWHVSENPK